MGFIAPLLGGVLPPFSVKLCEPADCKKLRCRVVRDLEDVSPVDSELTVSGFWGFGVLLTVLNRDYSTPTTNPY